MPEHYFEIPPLPVLSVVTRPLISAADFQRSAFEFAVSSTPLLWMRNGSGMVGHHETLRLTFAGADRFKNASATWKKLVSLAEVDDSVKVPGSGLTAFASFAFADDSERNSVLVVPRVIIGSMHGAAWVTTVAVKTQNEAAFNSDTAHISPAAIEELKSAFGETPVASFVEPVGEANAYRDGVHEASLRIGRGEAEKIVLARRLQSGLPEGDLRVALARLANRYTDCWTFSVDGMIGASPETLIRSIEGRVSARVLAGTRKRALDPERDVQMRDELQHSSKERFEHKLAVDSLVDTLNPYVLNLQAEADPHLLKLPNVWHLATDVTADLAHGADVLELAGAVHPTAAVAGTPTPLAVAAIGELEPFDRGRYAGAVGWVDADGDGDFAIALRSAQVDGVGASRTITAYAGGGLVAGSDPWHELTETVAKFRPIIEAFS
ncbi:MAG TPA: chorismate-binding protein [Microbacteriaceae bacterium]|nr:chorismate-binding protein [Microbacteriaceae bacterium]